MTAYLRSMYIYIIGVCLALMVSSAGAVIETYEFDDDSQRERYHQFTDELRCPKCQNQNLSGSNSPIAKDLRRELHRLLQEGQSDQQIIGFMVERYGEFVLYRPRFNAETAILWIAPAIFFVLGGLILGVIVIKQRKNTELGSDDGNDTPSLLDQSEREQLDSLLSEVSRRE